MHIIGSRIRHFPSVALLVLASLIAILILPAGARAGPYANSIVFKVKTSQGLGGTINYRKKYVGVKNDIEVDVNVVATCTGGPSSSTRAKEVSLSGAAHGNAYSDVFTLPPPGITETHSATVNFTPGGRLKRPPRLPRWRKATGTVQFTSEEEITDDETGNLAYIRRCDSGPVSFVTKSSRYAKLYG